MAMITYDNKTTLNPQPSVADVNKVTSGDMNEIKSVVNTNYGEVGDITNLTTPDKTSIVNAINSMQGTILWTNTSPTSSFTEQNITLLSSDYDILEIIFDQGTSLDKQFSQKFIKGKGTFLQCFLVSGTSVYFRWRNITRNSDTEYRIGACYQQIAGSTSSASANSGIIPLYIIGYNTGLFS